MREMSWALAGRMAVWTILAIVGYLLFILAVVRLCVWLSQFYPPIETGYDEQDEEWLP